MSRQEIGNCSLISSCPLLNLGGAALRLFERLFIPCTQCISQLIDNWLSNFMKNWEKCLSLHFSFGVEPLNWRRPLGAPLSQNLMKRWVARAPYFTHSYVFSFPEIWCACMRRVWNLNFSAPLNFILCDLVHRTRKYVEIEKRRDT